MFQNLVFVSVIHRVRDHSFLEPPSSSVCLQKQLGHCCKCPECRSPWCWLFSSCGGGLVQQLGEWKCQVCVQSKNSSFSLGAIQLCLMGHGKYRGNPECCGFDLLQGFGPNSQRLALLVYLSLSVPYSERLSSSLI